MPTVLIEGPYRFFWYSGDRTEPPHVHVERDDKTAKFWLYPVALARNNRFNNRELKRIEQIVRQNAQVWIERWNREFGN